MRVLNVGVVMVVLAASTAMAQSPPSGEFVFRSQCSPCHHVDARTKVGPGLAGIWNRRAGLVENFRYSLAMRDKTKDGLLWDEANLRAYLRSPREFIPYSSMAYAGLRDGARLSALIDYLRERSIP